MEAQRPHAVCIPTPAQGHIGAMLKLAKLLNHKGFHITYVLTQLNYTHIMQARNFRPLNQTPTFRFEAIPDGIPEKETRNSAIDLAEIAFSVSKNCSAPFKALIQKLNVASEEEDVPPVSCIVSDACMSSTTIEAAQELGIPAVMFWPLSGVGSMLHLQSPHLRDKWGFGLEIELDVNRENVESVVRELMEGEKGREAKQKAMFWKKRGETATAIGGSSILNLDKLIGQILLGGG
nr:7-deoxyloganetin glucosyltransferase-like isoform X2 [Ipomoea trifida]